MLAPLPATFAGAAAAAVCRAGKAFFVRNKTNGGGDGRRPGGYRVFYTLGPAKIVDPASDSNGSGNGSGGGKEGEAPAAPV